MIIWVGGVEGIVWVEGVRGGRWGVWKEGEEVVGGVGVRIPLPFLYRRGIRIVGMRVLTEHRE